MTHKSVGVTTFKKSSMLKMIIDICLVIGLVGTLKSHVSFEMSAYFSDIGKKTSFGLFLYARSLILFGVRFVSSRVNVPRQSYFIKKTDFSAETSTITMLLETHTILINIKISTVALRYEKCHEHSNIILRATKKLLNIFLIFQYI